ncbi:G-type lectin S-receptor-like serine/threonine-protein kinase LECRK3 [Neltuma alba]|uniref:G-type lectin S-receptor-like serine/threonine-protein kinase LECRK3 n=1 Tax=Neltuma alba TaxID=207710 RepID=UPI0010A3E3EC|nr:G-type lectin S-receptor-like serine/threonine-protein kinase LECRK3 [Prosopis alba]
MAFVQLSPIFLSLLFALLSLSVAAQTSRNIMSPGSSLTAVKDGSSFCASTSDEFAFGFKQIEEDGFLLAIWFNKILETTVVWSANGQKLVPEGSKVELTSNGWFHLVDPKGKQIWNANPLGNEIARAAMLDSGNFVLFGHDSQKLWQSFAQPTDTILPGQVLKEPAKLVSRYLETDYSSGRFQFKVQTDGNLVLYTTNFPKDEVNFPYWSTQVLDTARFSLNFNLSGYIFLGADNGSIISTISSNAPSTQDFYQRAVLDYDGVFRHYICPKNDSSSTGKWSIVSVTPLNICLRVTEKTGSGACGWNSYCTFNGTIKSCHCPRGYSFIDPRDVMKGCKQDFASQSCDQTSSETDLFDFDEMPNTDWPESDYEHFQSVTEDWCRQECLEDCFCSSIIFRDGECWKKKKPLSNGREDPSIGGKALIKIRKDQKKIRTDHSPSSPGDIDKKTDQSTLIIIGSTLLGGSVFLNFLLLIAACLVAYRFRQNNSKVHKNVQFISNMNLRSFSYEELEEATHGFTEQLGRGAFSIVYKGFLPDIPGNLIAVKKLNMFNGSDKEFEVEVSAIGRTHHRNLVQLLGFCNEGEHRLLVYEFMSRGTLANFLFEDQRPTWHQRVQIAIGIAKGLLYLHEDCNTRIIHCDIKPQNVLLDDCYTAKISDFGIAKLLKIDQSVTTTAIRGTKGYVAAEWFKNQPITLKVDVYSFGVLLLELICCRKNFDMNVEDEHKMILIDWAYDCFHYRRLDLLVEDDEEAQMDMKRAEEYVKISIWCIQENPSIRPTMKQIVQMLEGVMDVSNPPDLPSFTS